MFEACDLVTCVLTSCPSHPLCSLIHLLLPTLCSTPYRPLNCAVSASRATQKRTTLVFPLMLLSKNP